MIKAPKGYVRVSKVYESFSNHRTSDIEKSIKPQKSVGLYWRGDESLFYEYDQSPEEFASRILEARATAAWQRTRDFLRQNDCLVIKPLGGGIEPLDLPACAWECEWPITPIADLRTGLIRWKLELLKPEAAILKVTAEELEEWASMFKGASIFVKEGASDSAAKGSSDTKISQKEPEAAHPTIRKKGDAELKRGYKLWGHLPDEEFFARTEYYWSCDARAQDKRKPPHSLSTFKRAHKAEKKRRLASSE